MMTDAMTNRLRRSRKLFPAAGILLAGLLLSACYGWSTQYTYTGTAPLGFTGISCASTSDCVAVAEDVGDSPPLPSTIVTTTNGGSTWSSPSGGTDQNLLTVSCPDTTHCMAGGNNLVNGQYVGGIWVTSNPQGTWTLTPNLTGVNTVLALSCANDSDCFALVEGDFANGPQALIQTVNGGQTWSFVLSEDTSQFVSLSCPAATVCYLVGQYEAGYAEVFSTTNLFNFYRTDLSGTAYVTGISCTTTTSCMVVGNSVAFSTTNGSTWVNDSSALDADTGSALGSIAGVSCVGAGDCTVVGDPASGIYGQSVADTNNGGTTWQIEALASPSDLYAVSCASTTTCWAASSTSIVATTNGGVASPQLSSLSPTSGPAGTTVTISGDNLNSTPVSVDFGSVAATNVTVVSASEITAVAPSATATGTVDVRVHTSLGISPYVIGDQFTYTG
jgi:hypothetical protein